MQVAVNTRWLTLAITSLVVASAGCSAQVDVVSEAQARAHVDEVWRLVEDGDTTAVCDRAAFDEACQRLVASALDRQPTTRPTVLCVLPDDGGTHVVLEWRTRTGITRRGVDTLTAASGRVTSMAGVFWAVSSANGVEGPEACEPAG